ncbi:30S ribosomal protein S3 [Candidatus Desantisbacteria bacterium CG2_30_40_21]|uniref:Small ribosomal subunit protein uS3 n=5 Tax=unclassified Candidatus Desantisiibacteriota TaxID=3106372 RepID=A0A2M7JF30_9BACT|nr:ribosomal protein S3 [uncultured bacterium]OIP43546.1 MAG: 30S ribosomal protein S3 [Candidatus Desantisbacteria bacterium CG2_30_40_21]PIP39392.1 MAG: 30S ribosomal protein S3 [Candidatus Desantisbacteria bacterium CG23_combo_of_CG06-09_8_20_14_all_40_23]PIX17992.1 MAG: 30S ribosomal protein S3 [Candidatus Desantisbacteria bacterium CG_4_8_14_3_um_filter_40_12]PIY19564.1 MAG: 30S ribosomal protein S3 [Candidatus Desantisbacteria bacterium CG_4_10_14_3_um_filter_40_18]PJB30211.1 MAG: 30S ri
MGQKVHPIGFRVNYLYDWESRWFNDRSYSRDLIEDIKIRRFIKNKLQQAGVAKIVIERFGQKMRISIYSSRPGIIIGRGGQEIDKLRKIVQPMTKAQLLIDIQEIKNVEINAQLVSENIAQQLVKRVAFRRAMKQAVTTALRNGALGIKVMCAGRLGGAEIARTEWYREGRVPLQTIRADVDYGFYGAKTTFGLIGVKVWIFKGEIIDRTELQEEECHVDAKKG